MIQALKQFLKAIDQTTTEFQQLQTHSKLISEIEFIEGQAPKKIVNHNGMLMDILQSQIMHPNNQEWFTVMEILVTSFQLFPSIAKKNPSKCERTLDILIVKMANISPQISQFWYQPPDIKNWHDVNEVKKFNPDFGIYVRCYGFAYRVLSVYKSELVMKIYFSKLLAYSHETDWRWRSAAMVVISQITPSKQIAEMDQLISLCVKAANDSNVVVRFAASQALALLVNSNKMMKKKYLEVVFPLFESCLHDEAETVAAHWMSCLINLAQQIPDQVDISPYLDLFLERIKHFVSVGKNLTRENAILALGSIVTNQNIFNDTQVQQLFQFLNSLFVNPLNYSDQLLWCLNETYSILIFKYSGVGHAYIPQYLGILDNFIKKISVESLSSSWARICSHGRTFQNWQSLFKKISQEINSSQNLFKNNYRLFSKTAKCFKSDFYQFVPEVISLLSQRITLKYNQSQDVSDAVKTLTTVIIQSRPANPDEWWNTTVVGCLNFVNSQVTTHINLENYAIVTDLYDSLKKIFKAYHFIFQQEMIKKMIDEKIEQLKALLAKKEIFNSSEMGGMNEEQEIDEEIYKQKKDSKRQGLVECIEEVPSFVINFLKAIHDENDQKAMIQDIVNLAIGKIESNINEEQDIQFGLLILCDLLETLNFTNFSSYCEKFDQILQKFSNHSNAKIRNSSTFALGEFIKQIPQGLVNEGKIQQWIETIKKSFEQPRRQEKQSTYGHARDNCVTVVGKIIKFWGKTFNVQYVYDGWLDCLPLRHDLIENSLQLTLLLQILELEPEILLPMGNLETLIRRIMKIMIVLANSAIMLRKGSDVPAKNIRNHKLLIKMREMVKKMSCWQIYLDNKSTIESQLTAKQINSLNYLVDFSSNLIQSNLM